MFRDLKEYQQIQKIYEERVCITEEERYITKELKETFTEDEISFIAENTEEVFTEIGNQLAEEGFEITEEAIDEMAKVISKVGVPLAQRMATAASKLGGKSGGIVKKVASGGGTIAKKGIPTPAGGSGGLMQKAGGLIKKGIGFVKKNLGKITGTVAAGAAGGAIGAAATKGPKVERDSSGKIIPSTDSIRKGSDRVGGGNAGASTDSGGTQGKGGAPVTTSSAPQKKMHSIEKKNRLRMGDAKVDALKAKNKDFQAMKKGDMSKADFIKKYPKSITAQKSQGLRDHVEKDAYDIVLEYLLSSQQAATIEEANHIMIEMDAKTIQSIVAE